MADKAIEANSWELSNMCHLDMFCLLIAHLQDNHHMTGINCCGKFFVAFIHIWGNLQNGFLGKWKVGPTFT